MPFFRNISGFYEFFRYIGGCGCGLILKLLLTVFFSVCGLPIWLGYLLTQLLLLFTSFFFHYFITFQRKFEGIPGFASALFHFTAAVLFFKALDYGIVVGGSVWLERFLFREPGVCWQQELFHAGMILFSSGILFLLRYFCFRYLFRKKDYQYYTGSILKNVYLTHAVQPEIAGNAASGGMVTALLSGMLRRKEIDGAIVSTMTFNGTAQPVIAAKIVHTAEELKSAQGSIYTDFTFISSALLDELEKFQGKLAVVGLPCQLRALAGIGAQNPRIAEKIVLKIGLFCGHTSRSELLEMVLQQKGVAAESLVAFRFRKGPWRGYAEAQLCGGEVRTWPAAFYNLYQNLFIAAPRRCMCCFDHFAEAADISTGDVWCLKYRFESIKPSMTAIRTDAGERAFTAAVQHGDLTAEPRTVKELFAANSRSVIFHKAIAARAKVLAKYGIAVPVPAQAAPARWNELLAARIIVRFFLMPPENALRIPRRLLKFCLYLMKGLTSF